MKNEAQPSTRQRIEDLHKGIESVDPRKLKEKIKAGTHNPESETNHLKTEINAMTAYFIEEIWAQTTEAIKAQSPGVSEFAHVFSEQEVSEKCLGEKIESFDALKFLSDGTNNFLNDEMLNWYNMREAEANGSSAIKDERKNKAYIRFRDLLLTPGFKKERKEPEQKTPVFHISSGFNTAVFTIWETMKILPEVYGKQFEKSMPKDEFVKLARNSLPVIYALANSHLTVFLELQERYSWDRVESTLRGLSSDAFHFSGGPSNLRMELNEVATQDIQLPKSIPGPRTGCPAIFSLGPNHKNVIAEMADWFIDLAEKYYLPVLEKEGRVA